jgi:hypothetical protein
MPSIIDSVQDARHRWNWRDPCPPKLLALSCLHTKMSPMVFLRSWRMSSRDFRVIGLSLQVHDHLIFDMPSIFRWNWDGNFIGCSLGSAIALSALILLFLLPRLNSIPSASSFWLSISNSEQINPPQCLCSCSLKYNRLMYLPPLQWCTNSASTC